MYCTARIINEKKMSERRDRKKELLCFYNTNTNNSHPCKRKNERKEQIETS